MTGDMPRAIHASKVKRQLERLKTPISAKEHKIANYAVKLLYFIKELQAVPLSTVNVEKLFSYQVPELTADGCGRMDGTLAPEPYDLKKVFGYPPVASNGDLRGKKETRQLFILDSVVERVIDDVGVNWLGFYQRRKGLCGKEALVKLAYRGMESRAEFPLTREFAQKSNNATVGMTGQGVVINDIERYLWEEGGPYYQCDGRTHSEVCLPVFSPSGEDVIGIIDAESYERNKFSEAEIAMLVGTSIAIDEILAPV